MSTWFRRKVAYRRPLLLEQLEERIVLDAAVDSSSQENNDQSQPETPQDMGGTQAPPEEASGNHESQSDQASDPLSEIFSQDLSEFGISNGWGIVSSAQDQPETEKVAGIRVLAISSGVEGANLLAEAAKDGVLAVLYDATNDNLSTILSTVESALDGQQASSIAFATHDLGQACFHLTGGYSVSAPTLLADAELQSFWAGVGELLTDDGRIDLMACDLASGDAGEQLVSQLEGVTGHDVAASDDPTGNPEDGGDWVLETDDVDLASLYFVQSALGDFDGLLAAEYKITATDWDSNDQFGYSVSISGDRIIVGANTWNPRSVYAYKWDGNDWTNERILTASDEADSSQFGKSVCISGNYAIVGDYQGKDHNGDMCGSAYLYQCDGNNWTEQQKLTASDAASADWFGYSVSISGDFAIVGAWGNDDNGSNSGSAYIYHSDGSNWVQKAKLTASDAVAEDEFGYSVSISGDYAIVGARENDDDGSNSGSAYIYHWDGSSWTEQQKLTASDAAATDYFGNSVSISGDYAIVGARENDDDGSNSGSAYIYHWDGSNWTEQKKLTASDAAAADHFGHSVAISGDYAIVGALYSDDNGSESGSAYVYYRDGSNWTNEEKLTASDAAGADHFGKSVSISGDYAIVGAPDVHIHVSGGIKGHVGAAYVFEYNKTPTDISISNDSVLENRPADTVVGTFDTVDRDTNDTHTYTLVSGDGSDGNDSFRIVGTDLLTKGPFDYENKDTHTIRVRAVDAADAVYEKVFTIYVKDLNEEPTYTGPTSAVTNEEEPVEIGQFTGEDNDVDVDQTLTYWLKGGGNLTNGDLYPTERDALNRTNAIDLSAADVEVTWGDSVWFMSDPDNDVDTSFELYVTDDGGTANGGDDTSDNYNVEVTVASVNDEPSYTGPTSASTDEDVPVEIGAFTGDDGDPDNGDPFNEQTLGYWLAEGSLTNGDLYRSQTDAQNRTNAIDLSDGDVEVTWGDSVWFMSDPDDNGPSSFELYVTDDGGTANGGDDTSENYTIDINVDAVNDPPVITGLASQTLLEDNGLAITGISISDVDVDEGTGEVRVSLSVSHGSIALSRSDNLTFEAGANGEASMMFTGLLADVNDALATLNYSPSADYFGTDSLYIEVNDLGNTGGGGKCLVEGAMEIEVLTVPEFDEFGKSYDYPSNMGDGIGIETGPLNTTESGPAIGHLLEFLSTRGLLSQSLTNVPEEVTESGSESQSQFETLLHRALFGQTPESQDQAWNSLLSLVSGKKAEVGEEWLGLEDFFLKVKEWQIGKSLDEILLVFNADEIKLIEWFSSLISSEQEALGTEQASALNIEDHVQQSHSSKALVFEMNKMRAADLLLVDIGGPDLADSHEPLGEASRAACTVFDLSAMSFMNLVC
jgi:hypothetical protein